MCLFKLQDEENVFVQISHENGFSPVCVRKCTFKLDKLEHSLPQSPHSKTGLSTLCTSWCLLKLQDDENVFEHISHVNGFSPVWVRLCTFKFDKLVHSFPHVSHLKTGLSPLWISLCLFKLLDTENVFEHISHVNGFSPVWVWLWTLRFDKLLHSLPQIPHLKTGLSPLWIRVCLFRLQDVENVFEQISHENNFS